MRVLHVISGLGPGGAEHMLWRLIEATPDVQHLVFSLSGEGALSENLQAAGAIMLNGETDSRRGFRNLTALRNHAARHVPHVIQGWMYHGNLAALAAKSAALRATLFWNIRQSLTDKRFTKLSTHAVIRAQAACSRIPHAVIYNSVAGAHDHEKIGFNKDKRVIVPNGFNTELFRPNAAAREAVRAELGLSADHLVIGLIARYDPWKNHQGFFQMAGRLADRHPNVVFILAGKNVEWRNQELSALIGAGPLRDRIFLLGDRRDVSAIDAALDIACNVSHGEGFPNAVGEAMACGVPCVVTPVGASAELVGECGLITSSTKVNDLAEAVEAMIQTPEPARRALGEAARNRILTHFSIKAVAGRYLDLYAQSLTSGCPAQGPQLVAHDAPSAE